MRKKRGRQGSVQRSGRDRRTTGPAVRASAPAPLARRLIAHAAMGAAIGCVLATAVLSNHQLVYSLIKSSPAPRLAMLVFIAALSGIFAVGASLSACVLLLFDETDGR